MPKKTKAERKREAMEAEGERMLQRLYSLSGMVLRSDAAMEAYHEAQQVVEASGRSHDALVAEARRQTERVENSTFTKSAELLMIHLALLYTVIEGWRKWEFADDEVDQLLLRTDLVEQLKKFRHAMFHAVEFDDAAVVQFSASDDRVQWLSAVSNAIRRALREWHDNLLPRLLDHLIKKNLI